MKNPKNPRLLTILVGLALLPTPARAANPAKALEGFDIAQEPSKADWRFFIKAPEARREQLWTYHARRGKQLKDWAWGWRLGWVRVCGSSGRPLCAQLLTDALSDKALVVRAEAATQVGRLYEGTGDGRVVAFLAKAFGNARNLRNGKPLFVQQRLLFALHQVGGDAGRAAGQHLAVQTADLKAYWERLDRAE